LDIGMLARDLHEATHVGPRLPGEQRLVSGRRIVMDEVVERGVVGQERHRLVDEVQNGDADRRERRRAVQLLCPAHATSTLAFIAEKQSSAGASDRSSARYRMMPATRSGRLSRPTCGSSVPRGGKPPATRRGPSIVKDARPAGATDSRSALALCNSTRKIVNASS